jgi:tetratricopeptide (TPR) repeat protein
MKLIFLRAYSLVSGFIILSFLVPSCSVLTPLQKSKLLTVSNLIETSKFLEAREVVEEMIVDEEASLWSRTWYLRGQLCHIAYQEGIKKKDKKLYELYPDQLYTAFESYQKALSLDRGGKLDRLIAPRFVLLANDFQKMAESLYAAGNYKDSFRAFYQTVQISQHPLLEIEPDQNLLYNTALAAFESKEWEKAVELLGGLHRNSFSLNATHLLFKASLAQGDTLSAKQTLREGIDQYQDQEVFVLLLANLLFDGNEVAQAHELLDEAANLEPDNYRFPYTRGLIYQKTGNYHEAIAAYTDASILAPEELTIYLNLATCHYNIGVEVEEAARTISNSRLVQQEKAKSSNAFESAVKWLDKAWEMGLEDKALMSRFLELYRSLQVLDKVIELENRIR